LPHSLAQFHIHGIETQGTSEQIIRKKIGKGAAKEEQIKSSHPTVCSSLFGRCKAISAILTHQDVHPRKTPCQPIFGELLVRFPKLV
jgi:hypothetical protein